MASTYRSLADADEPTGKPQRMRADHLPHSGPMRISTLALGTGVLAVALLSGCVFDGSEPTEASDAETDPEPDILVEVPPERLSPFCVAMTDLTDRVRAGEEVTTDEIVDTYRSIVDDVPAVIADDFGLVLEALETGAPPPTDAPRDTIETVPPPDTTTQPTGATTTSTTTTTTSTTSTTVPDASGDEEADASAPASVVVDERFDRDSSPAERINSYVSFACRDTDNNPGPPATQPLEAPPSDG